MNQQEIMDMCREAFKNHEVEKLLTGKEPYRCGPDRSVPGSVPTSWESILRCGIHPVCEADASGQRILEFRQAMRQLLRGSAVDIWCAYYVYFYECYIEKEKSSWAALLDSGFRQELGDCLRASEEVLRACRLWQGKYRADGLWGDVCHADAVLQKRHQTGVL